MSAATLWSGSLAAQALRTGYASGWLSPVEVIDEVYRRIRARGDDHVWISLVPHHRARAAAAALDPADLPGLPLFGLPFAVKDNIDVEGLLTTAACPGFAYSAAASAALVDRLLAAGAVLVGKTNLDQFATGLNGTRSPYGIPSSAHDPALIAGGSSSGSAVAVAAGLVSFAVGTDTAGSGRVPAALNGVIGVKPSIGLVSAAGVVPACRSLDCPSVFSLDVGDGAAVLQAMAGFDPMDPWSRRLPRPPAVPAGVAVEGLRLGVPESIGSWGERGERDAWDGLLERLLDAGVRLVPVDLAPLFEAGDQLYRGAWLAERLEGLEDFVAAHADDVLPEIRSVIQGGESFRGTEVFAAMTRMATLRRRAAGLLTGLDALLTPTVVETFTIEEMLADPIDLNSRLGRFTTFTNLLDLCGVAIPAGHGVAGAPFGVTLQHGAGRDAEVAAVASALERLLVGAPAITTPATDQMLEIAVVGAHLRGMPLHDDLLRRGATLVQRTATSPTYRLYALPGDNPARPGLCRVTHGGAPIEIEVYRLPRHEVGDFLATISAPLAIGQVTLADDRVVHGFVCEPAALDHARDITDYGGWRAYQHRGRLTR